MEFSCLAVCPYSRISRASGAREAGGPAPAPSSAETALALSGDSLFEYTGVRSVRASGPVILIKVEMEAEAIDLRMLLGTELQRILHHVTTAS